MKNSVKTRHLGLHQGGRNLERSSRVVAPSDPKDDLDFIELLGRSNFSFLQGASHPEEMVHQAAILNYKGLALCDLNGLYGVARGFKAAKSPSQFSSSVNVDEKFKYFIGTELNLIEQISVVLLPMNKAGYSALCELLTLGKRDVDKGYSKLSINDIKLKSENMICFLLPPYTEDQFLDLQNSFKDQLYLPVWRDFTWESRKFCSQAFLHEEKHNAQLFVTNRPLMHVKEKYPLFDTLTCIQHHKKIEEANEILLQNAERYLKPLGQLKQIWQDRLDLIDETIHIAQKIDFSLDEIRYRYPNSNLPQGFSSSDYLRYLTYEGLKRRGLDQDSQILKTVEHELGLIKLLQYEDYFLTLY